MKKSKKDKTVESAQTEEDVPLPTDAPDDEVALKKKSKKDKKRDSAAQSASTEGQEGVFADATLTDQAKKGGLRLLNLECRLAWHGADGLAIHYVQLHAATHGKKDLPEDGQRWKFNKARQGWLMRNVWNETEVSTPLHK